MVGDGLFLKRYLLSWLWSDTNIGYVTGSKQKIRIGCKSPPKKMLAKCFVSKTLRRMHRDCKVHIEAGNIWKYALSFENEFQISGPLKLKYCHFQFGLKNRMLKKHRVATSLHQWRSTYMYTYILCIYIYIIPRGYGYMVWNMQRSWRGNSFSFVLLNLWQNPILKAPGITGFHRHGNVSELPARFWSWLMASSNSFTSQAWRVDVYTYVFVFYTAHVCFLDILCTVHRTSIIDIVCI